jgi:hypothetical protein
MAQLAAPDADTLVTGWETQAGGTTNLFATIDEAVTDDADYVVSPDDPVAAVAVFRLSNPTDPTVNTGHSLTVRARGVNGLPSLTFQLRQGYVNEGSQGTLIAGGSITTTGSFANYSVSLSEAEAATITDYTALFIRLVATA